MEVRSYHPVGTAAEPIHRAPGHSNPAPSHPHGHIRYVRPTPPASFTITFDDAYGLFLRYSSVTGDYYASDPFEVGGYHWKLCVYPEGKNAKDYISLYLAVADEGIDLLPKRWEAYVSLKMFVYNQIEDNYLTVEDDNQGFIRFHEGETTHGCSHFISHETFLEPLNGYLVNNCCTFGVEIFIVDTAATKSESCKMNSNQFPKMEFQIDCPSFSKQTQYSKHCFVTAGGRDWKITLFPKGKDTGEEYLSFEVKLADDDDVTMSSLEAKLVGDAATSCSKVRSTNNATRAFKKLLRWLPSFHVGYQKLSQWLPTLNVWSKPIELESATSFQISLCIKTESRSPHQEVMEKSFLSSEECRQLFQFFMPLDDLLDESKQFLVDDNLRTYVTIETLLVKNHRHYSDSDLALPAII